MSHTRRHLHARLPVIGAIVVVGGLLCAGCLVTSCVSLPHPDAPSVDDCPDGTCPLPSPKQLDKLKIIRRPPGSNEPVVDLPEAMRQKNYLGGSCVHASTITLLRWNGLDQMAEWWRANHGHGEYADRLNSKMEAARLRYAYTTEGSVRFLEWCIRTRRGAGIGYKPSHAINLVDLTRTHAILLDNNRIDRYEKVPRDEFIRRWQREYGGWAWTLVYQPPPPKPWRGAFWAEM